MNPPFFSVVMPVFNRSAFLHQSISSVLSQSFKDFELICIDDGSTDQSFEILQQFAQQDHRVKVIRNENNLGRCAARNSGIVNALASWICFLDSDDRHKDNHLAVFHRLIVRYPDNFGFATSIETRHGQGGKDRAEEIISLIKLKDIIYTNMLPPNVLCYNKEKVKTLFANENIPISEDWLFSRMLLTETDFLKTNTQTTIISEHPERSMNTEGIQNIAYWNEYTGKLFANHLTSDKKLAETVLSHTYLLCANMLISAGNKKDSIPPFVKSFSFSRTFVNPLFYKYVIKYMIK